MILIMNHQKTNYTCYRKLPSFSNLLRLETSMSPFTHKINNTFSKKSVGIDSPVKIGATITISNPSHSKLNSKEVKMKRNELLKYNGQKVSICMLGCSKIQFGTITNIKNRTFRLKNDRIGTIDIDSVLAVGSYYA